MKSPLFLLPLAWASVAWSAETTVDVSFKPGDKYVAQVVRTLADLPPRAPDKGLNLYGGLAEPKARATGFFRVERQGGRWWFIDPLGGRFLHKGVASVRTIPTKGATAALTQLFKDNVGWGEVTAAQLKAAGFNGTGSWSDDDALAGAKDKLVRTKLLSLMSGYGKKRGGTFMQPGHTGYPGDCPFIFDAGFEAYCKEVGQTLAVNKTDPWLLGYYTDNELPWSQNLLDNYLKLPAEDAGRQAAEAWLAERKAKPAALSSELRDAFLEYAAEHYFRVTANAIRGGDPNHLILGARFYGKDLALQPLFSAIGRHCDVVSVNYYRAWTPDAKLLAMWERVAGRPFLITEWYAKGEDSGMGNTGGAGWLVRTQSDRGLFYQHFTLQLLAQPGCVGWHWFRYSDNDPDDKKVDPSNRDSNKGIVSSRYVPYAPLLDAMTQLNQRAYGLAEAPPPAAK